MSYIPGFSHRWSMTMLMAMAIMANFRLIQAVREPLVAPFVDVTRMPKDYLVQVHKETGLKAVTLAFVIGTGFGCTPSWGAERTLNDTNILDQVKAFQKLGGSVIIATGGALGPYLENSCSTPDQLAQAYKTSLDVVGSTHLDIDVEATVNTDLLMKSLKQLKSMMPQLTVSFTLMVQSDDYGLNDPLGVDVLKKAVQAGVQVDIVNPMTMEFGSSRASWGDAVIAAGESVLRQMKTIWPQKSDRQLNSMLGITPMIGRNFNGKIFQQGHARNLVDWARDLKIGHLSFWSIGRDNGDCPNAGVSPDCSSIVQKKFEFCKIFKEFDDGHRDDDDDDDDHDDDPSTQKPSTERPTERTEPPTAQPTTRPSTRRPTTQPSTKRPPTTTSSSTTTKRTPKKIDCSNGETYIPHETYCSQYYWCFEGRPHLETCADHLVWDPTINACNYARDAHRTDCI